METQNGTAAGKLVSQSRNGISILALGIYVPRTAPTTCFDADGLGLDERTRLGIVQVAVTMGHELGTLTAVEVVSGERISAEQSRFEGLASFAAWAAAKLAGEAAVTTRERVKREPTWISDLCWLAGQGGTTARLAVLAALIGWMTL